LNAATVEILAAGVLGLAVLWLVLSPLLAGAKPVRTVVEPPLPEETPQGQALLALKEIEFDRETGKLSDADYEMLKTRYTARALAALRNEHGSAGPGAAVPARGAREVPPGEGTACPTCGPRPEEDAVFCSSCGGRLPTGRECRGCGSAVSADASFCESCGQPVAA
jgi:hypothetical protein